jgi:SAM-dependent methyltransferase
MPYLSCWFTLALTLTLSIVSPKAFDNGCPSPSLTHILDAGYLKNRAGGSSNGDEKKPMIVLVPGAGRGYDAHALAQSGHRVVSVDLSATCCECAVQWLTGATKNTRVAVAYEVAVICGDFFTLDFADVLGSTQHAALRGVIGPSSADSTRWQFDKFEKFDAVWDCTFLCALDPEVRNLWAARYAEVLADDGELWTLLFPMMEKEGGGVNSLDLTTTPGSGPPYCLNLKLLSSLLAPHGFQPIRVITEEHGLPGHMSMRQSLPLEGARSTVVCWTRSAYTPTPIS